MTKTAENFFEKSLFLVFMQIFSLRFNSESCCKINLYNDLKYKYGICKKSCKFFLFQEIFFPFFVKRVGIFQKTQFKLIIIIEKIIIQPLAFGSENEKGANLHKDELLNIANAFNPFNETMKTGRCIIINISFPSNGACAAFLLQ